MVMVQCTELGNDTLYRYVGTSKLLASFVGRGVAEGAWYIT